MGILAQNDRERRVLRSNYRLLGLTGQGQFGKVYCGAHRKSGKLVALKSLDRYRLSTQQFLRELRFLLSLRHRNIVACQSLEHSHRGRYLVMDYCPGGTLRELLEDEQCLVNWQQGLKLIGDVLQGLAHAHDQKIIHCDIKPENILLDPTPQGWVARITDFGIAHVMQDLKVGSGTSGSPAYMAPERFYGQYHLSADLYAVGIILFELLLGERPFTGTPLELMSAHLNQSPAIPASVPPALGQVLAKSLKKLPKQRFQSAAEMQAALAQAIVEIDLRSSQPSPYFRLPESLSPAQPWPSPLARWSGSVFLKAIALPCPRLESSGSTVMSEAGFYGAIDQQVFYHPLSPGFPKPERDVAALLQDGFSRVVPGRITHLQGIAQGCLVGTTEGLYHWNPQAETGHALTFLYAWEGHREVSVDPQQRWFAATSPNLAPNPTLLLGLLTDVNTSIASSCPLRKWELPAAIDSSFQVLGIDGGHGVILQDRQNQSWIQVFHRRGRILGELSLRLHVSHCTLARKLYRLVGLEPDQPHLVFIDLKPFRIRRIGLPGIPQAITCFSWGYGVLAGQYIFFLDTEGRIIGQVEDSIALDFTQTQLHAVQDWGLLLLRQSDRQTVLQIFDLHDLNLDLIF